MNKRNVKAKVLLESGMQYGRTDTTASTYEDMEFVDLRVMWTRLFRIIKSSPMFNNDRNYAIKYRLTDGTYFYIATNMNKGQTGKLYCNNVKLALESTPSRKRTIFSLMDWKANEDQRGIFDYALNENAATFPKEHVLGEIEDFIEDYLIYKN